MRTTGAIDAPKGLVLGDHVCWSYDDPSTFAAHAGDYFDEGVGRGERIMFVGDVGSEGYAKATRVAALQGRDGQVLVCTPEEVLHGRGATDLIEALRGDARRACDDGFTGLRLASDISPLLADLAVAAELVELERRFDAMVAESPMVALCAHDRRGVARSTVDDMMSAHPAWNAGAGPVVLSVHAAGCDVVRIVGELDLPERSRLVAALDALPGEHRALTIDLDGLSYADVGGLRTLGAWIAGERSRGREVAVHGARERWRWIWEQMGAAVP